MAKKDTSKPPQPAKGESGGNPVALPLFYKNPMPLDAKAHGSLALKKNFGFGYTRTANAVPVNMIEMIQISHFYPIAFSPDGFATPVCILGLRDSENLFVRKDGTWEDYTYIPAYIRRYPFIFSEMPGGEQLTLCIDNNPDVVDQKGEQRFFSDENKPTRLAEDALEFCKSYHAAAQQTIEFSKAIAAANLLVDREAQITVPGNKRINFSGFKVIDEEKFNAIDDKTFIDWRKKGWLAPIYAHITSVARPERGGQWHRLSRLLGERLEKEAA